MLMLTFCWSFSACKNNDNPPDDNQIEQQNPDLGGDNGSNEPEVFEPLTINDMFSLATDLNEDFFAGFNQDLHNGSFEINILNLKDLFLNSSSMINEIGEFENISHETILSGKEIEEINTETPNKLNKFYMVHSPENSDTYSKLEIRVLLSYKDKDVKYTYDYYNFLIETNQKLNTISYSCSIENSRAVGTNSSSAQYKVFNITCDLKNMENVRDYKVYSFERNKIVDVNLVNNTNIENFTKSAFDGDDKDYMNVDEGETALRNVNSAEHALIISVVSDLNQDLAMLQKGSAIKSITGLSEALIGCVSV